MEIFNVSTKRLLIRNLYPTDLLDFYFYRSNPEVTQYQGFDVMTMEQAGDFISLNVESVFGKAGEWVQFGIENAKTQQLIGDCAIKFDANDIRIAEIGITISHLEQQKGYAKEALTAIVKHLFENQSVLRIVEIVDTENIASVKMLESVGFKREGHFVENIFFKGKWGSEYQYAMLKKEWATLNQKH